MQESHQILITGAAGFIGYHLAKYFSSKVNYQIICVDNPNSYYDIDLKYDRLFNLGFTDIKNFKNKSKSLVEYSVKNENLIFYKQIYVILMVWIKFLIAIILKQSFI